MKENPQLFADWLNHVDATFGYDDRRKLGTVEQWRAEWLANASTSEAIENRRKWTVSA